MRQDSGTRSNPELEGRPPEADPDEHQAFNALVGGGIRRARQDRRWTQAFLAEQARLSPNYIARLERGELGPSLFVANRICDALAIPLETLVGAPASGAARKPASRRRAAG